MEEQEQELEQEQEQGQDGQSYPEIKKRLISADEARQLMVRSVRGLDSKLNEVSKIIQTTARRGETRAEVHSVQSSRSSLPIFDRIDNLGRVLLGSLRDSGYDAKLREFRTADSCMLYIVADWSRAMEKKPEDKLAKASEVAADAKRKPNTLERKPRAPQSAARARSASPSGISKKADDPAESESERALAPKAVADTQAKSVTDANIAGHQTADSGAEARQPSTAADGDNSAAKPNESDQAQNKEAELDLDKKEVKTKKFDRSKLLSRDAAKRTARYGQKLLGMGGNTSEDYAYSTEINGERIPIILPVIMPSPRLPL